MVCLLRNRKKRTCGINFFSRRWAAEFLCWKYSFFFLSNLLQQSYTQAHLLSCIAKTQNSNSSFAFRQDLYDHAKMPHLGQSHNAVIYMCADIKHDLRLGGCKFDLPNCLLLSPWSHFTRLTYLCMLSLTTQLFLKNYFQAIIVYIMNYTKTNLCWGVSPSWSFSKYSVYYVKSSDDERNVE